MFARLFILFTSVTALELFLIIQVGKLIGGFATVLLILLTGALGAWLTREQGLRTLGRFQRALAEGRMPQNEIMEGIMILIAGAVLLTPGLLTDAFGFLLLIPPTRRLIRLQLNRYLKDRVKVTRMDGGFPGSPGEETEDAELREKAKRRAKEKVIDAQIIDDENRL